MKCLRFASSPMLFALILTVLSASVIAQAPSAEPARIAFVNPNQLLEAVPEGREVTRLAQQRDKELAPLVAQVQAYEERVQAGQQLTAEEQSQARLLVRTVEETRAQYQEDIQALLDLVEPTITEAIANVAEANGYTLVLNRSLVGAQGFQIVIYGAATPDITELVLKRLEAGEEGS